MQLDYEYQVNVLAGKLNCLGLNCHHVKRDQYKALQCHYAALNILRSNVSRKDIKRSSTYSSMFWDTKNISMEAHIALTLSDIGNVQLKLANYNESAEAYSYALEILRKHCNLSDTHPRMEAIKRGVDQVYMYGDFRQETSIHTASIETKSASGLLTLSDLTSSAIILEDGDLFIKKSLQSVCIDFHQTCSPISEPVVATIEKSKLHFVSKLGSQRRDSLGCVYLNASELGLKYSRRISLGPQEQLVSLLNYYNRKGSVESWHSDASGSYNTRRISQTSLSSTVSSTSSSSYPDNPYHNWNHDQPEVC